MARPKGSKNKVEGVEEIEETTPEEVETDTVSNEAPDLIARRKLKGMI